MSLADKSVVVRDCQYDKASVEGDDGLACGGGEVARVQMETRTLYLGEDERVDVLAVLCSCDDARVLLNVCRMCR